MANVHADDVKRALRASHDAQRKLVNQLENTALMVTPHELLATEAIVALNEALMTLQEFYNQAFLTLLGKDTD